MSFKINLISFPTDNLNAMFAIFENNRNVALKLKASLQKGVKLP